MAELTVSDIFLIVLSDVVAINKVVRALGAKQIPTKAAMMPSPYQ